MKKLDLDKLKVQSFVTSLDSTQDNTIKGGKKVPKTDHWGDDNCVIPVSFKYTCIEAACRRP